MSYASVFRDELFAGQVALVTGGGTGIGRCTAHELAALGATVVVCGRRPEPLDATVAEITAAGGRAAAVPLDIRQTEDVTAALQQVVRDHGRLDILVNNAGGQFPAAAQDLSPNGWRSVVDLNLNGTFLVSRAAFHAWMGDHGGVIVSVVADMWNGFPGMAHTGASRAGVVNLTCTLAVEWAPYGIRVNAVAPGTVYSSGMESYAPQFQQVFLSEGRRIPAARLGTESEISAAIVFLSSSAAAFVTGATLRVDGGASLARVPLVEVGQRGGFPPFHGFHLARRPPDRPTSHGES